jgi:hypothetical protein
VIGVVVGLVVAGAGGAGIYFILLFGFILIL